MISKNLQKGFTLIELLVVVAIIGILSSIVLVSLNSARARAKDASAKGSMSSMRAAAELEYDNAGNYSTVCTVGKEPKNLLSAAERQVGGSAECNISTSGGAWAASLQLNSGIYCVDSNGFAGNVNSTLSGGATTCVSAGITETGGGLGPQ